MKKGLFFSTLILLTTVFFIALPVYAASSDFLTKATEYYQRNCTSNLNRISRSTAFFCYLYDKIQEQDQVLQNIENQVANLEASNSANISEINDLKTKSILTYGQYRGSGFTTTSNTDTPTDAKVDIACPITCVLVINYVVDTRNFQTGVNHIYTIYVDGVNQSFVNQVSVVFANQANSLALTGMIPASPSTHTVQIYARTTGGILEEHTKTLTVLAIGQ